MIKHAYSWVVGLLTAFAVLVALSLPGYAVKVEKVMQNVDQLTHIVN